MALQALALGLTDAYHVYHEIESNLEVVLLLVFMVSAIFFMKDLLLVIFTQIIKSIKNKSTLSFLFLISAAFLSVFMHLQLQLSLIVCLGFYKIFDEHHKSNQISDNEFSQGKNFLSDIVVHGAVGTALGGVCTIVGEPQNLLITLKLDGIY